MIIGKKILQLISKISDDFKREILLQQASETLQIPVSSLKDLVFKEKSDITEKNNTKYISKTNNFNRQNSHKNNNNANREDFDVPVLEERIFSVIINNLDKPDKLYVPEDLMEYFSKHIQYLLKKLNMFINENKDSSNLFGSYLNSLNEKDRNWVTSCSLKFNQKEDEQTFRELLMLFCKKYWKQIVQDVKEKILNAKQKQDNKRVKDLFELFSQLKDGIKTRGLI